MTTAAHTDSERLFDNWHDPCRSCSGCMLLERGQAGLRALRVLIGHRAADTDRANRLPIHHHRQSALDRSDMAEREYGDAALCDRILEVLARPPEGTGRSPLALRYFDRAERRAIHAFEVDEVGAVVEHCDDHRPFVLRRPGLGGSRHLLLRAKAQSLFT